ncbi:hypothetical protein, partial [Duganella lactea]|uniref:hypothetical protein n=1 Tax=Duganella lactea TaxID=2692173 RepID=UPI001E480751
STGNGYGSFFLRGFLVVIVSIMEHPFRYYFMTPFHTEILTGSKGRTFIATYRFHHFEAFTNSLCLDAIAPGASFVLHIASMSISIHPATD